MHRVGSAGNTAGSTRPRKEKRFTYVLNDADDKKHCAGINCLEYLNGSALGTSDYLFSGSRDGTLKRWELNNGDASFSATFESHVDWVNDAIIVGQKLVSCSSDTTLKVWNCFSDGACTRTLRQHSDYVICLAAAEKNSNIVASGGLGGEVFIWDLDAALAPVAKSLDAKEDEVLVNIYYLISFFPPLYILIGRMTYRLALDRTSITKCKQLGSVHALHAWVLFLLLEGKYEQTEIICGFYLHPAEGSPAPNITQGKLSAPRILRIHKVGNYVVEKLILDKPLDGGSDSTFAMGLTSGQSQLSALDSSSRLGLKPWQKLKPCVEILCNNQVLSPEMSLATVRTYIWKKPEDLILHYRVVQSR